MDSDSELLQRFAATRDEAAFSILVERHAGMVQGVAWRRTQNWAMAEEVTQSVFAILARKAKALRHVSLAGWLHHSAFLEARNACRKAARYRNALQQFSDHTTDMQSSEYASWEEIRPHLDEAMSRLSAEARHMVVMRFYERRSIQEIAATTGMNEETCRKRIQRSIHRLNSMLQRRGLLTTGTALAAVLAGESLCVPPASAAAIAAFAMKTAPTLTTASLLTYSIHAMNTALIIKTSAVVLVLAAIPLTILWQQNAGLHEEMRQLRGVPQMAQAQALVPAKRTGSALDGMASFTSKSSAPATVQAGSAPEHSTPRMAAPAMEKLRQKSQDKAKRRAALEFDRICLNLPDLTGTQKAQIKEAIDKRSSAAADQLFKAVESGAVARAVQNPERLTKEEKAVLAILPKMDPGKTTALTDDEALKSILTEEQFDLYAETQEARRVSDAENAATDTLKFIERKIDLNAEQKDRIFQQLAQYDLSPEAAAAAESSGHIPGMGAPAEAKAQIIRGNLTPQQTEVFDQLRAEEKRGREQEIMQFYSPPPVRQQETAR